MLTREYERDHLSVSVRVRLMRTPGTKALAVLLLALSAGIAVLAEDGVSPFRYALAPAAVVEQYTPLLPADALQRGLLLSGSAMLSKSSEDSYRMSCGCALITSSVPVRIDTCRARVYIQGDAAAVVHAESNSTRVLNLCDTGQKQVRVVFDKYMVELDPGREIVIVDKDVDDPQVVAAGSAIGFRRLKVIPAGNNLNVVTFDFAIADALKTCRIFRQLKQSPLEEDHYLLERIMKTAAAINTMYEKSRGEYKHDLRHEEDSHAKTAASKKHPS